MNYITRVIEDYKLSRRELENEIVIITRHELTSELRSVHGNIQYTAVQMIEVIAGKLAELKQAIGILANELAR
jgi:hypothetical protein